MVFVKKIMEFFRTYKIRMYPNEQARIALETTLDACRWLYNCALQERRDAYANWKRFNKGTNFKLYEESQVVVLTEDDVLGPTEGPNAIVAPKPPQVNRYTQSRAFTEFKQELPELLKYYADYPPEQFGQIPDVFGVFDHVLRDVFARVEKTFEAFYRRVKNGETPGYPRYKGKNRYDSFTFPDASIQEGETKAGGWSLLNNKLTLSKMGGLGKVSIRVKLHRPIMGKVCTLTICRQLDKWYACFQVKYSCQRDDVPSSDSNNDTTKPLIPSLEENIQNKVVGGDLGLEKVLTLSTGEAIEPPRYLQKTSDKLIALQQAVSRKKNGSNRRRKAVRKLAKLHRHVANQRRDFQHKLSHTLVKRFDVIALEKFEITKMVGRPKPVLDEEKTIGKGGGKEAAVYLPNGAEAKAAQNFQTLDVGWGMLAQFIAYKAEGAGKWWVQVQAADNKTNQTCSSCGTLVTKEPGEAWHHCPVCGLSVLRQLNTALNVRKLGLEQLVQAEAAANGSSNNNNNGSSTATATTNKKLIRRKKARNEPSSEQSGEKVASATIPVATEKIPTEPLLPP